jgi:hypothetical protein
MIINKLEMYNFRQYIGLQSVEFSTDPEKNVTVLIGINTSGKTTIVRAFEWCLYGKNGFDDRILINSDVRSNMNVGDVQDTWVSVTFTHDNKVYTLKRMFRYVCSERKLSDNPSDIEVVLSKNPEEKLTLEYLQNDGQTKTSIDRSNITESMDRVLPRDLSDYFFFGGERISGIANRTDLSKAVRGLMRLDVLENAREHLGKVLKSFQASIDTSGDVNAQKAKDALETFKSQLSVFEEDKNNADQQMQYWNGKEKEYSAELAKSNIDQVKKAKAERDRIERTLVSERKKLDNAFQAAVDSFNNRPYVFFGMPAIKRTFDLLERVKDSTESVPNMDQDSIDYLLKRGYCLCGTHLDPGSVPYLKMMEERKKLPPEHIGSVVTNYKTKAEGYLAGNETFLNVLEERYKEVRFIKRTIGQLEDEYNSQAELILDDTDAKATETKRREAHSSYLEAKTDFEQATQKVGRCNENIKNCEEAIEKYAKSSKKNERIARMISYTQAVYEWLNKTYQEKENTVRTELQKRVNDNFSRMYHGERSIIIDDKYRVKYSDVKTEESDGLKAVKSFAFIASLVSIAKDKILDDQEMQLGQVYPMVMDAPFSNVDEIHIDNICQILPNAANQVIMAVMKKDWDYAAGNLDKFVGKSFVIAKDQDAEGHEIETCSHIVPVEV